MLDIIDPIAGSLTNVPVHATPKTQSASHAEIDELPESHSQTAARGHYQLTRATPSQPSSNYNHQTYKRSGARTEEPTDRSGAEFINSSLIRRLDHIAHLPFPGTIQPRQLNGTARPL
ncbi:hypothetical protein DL765_007769 [Monosporascus sp. GIB2]|nr:hypothetical protein DL765_007769 [Monosporascus sp. GIB2]